MGSVADKIAKKILSSRGSKVVDLASWREGRKMALEAGFGDEGPIPGKFAGLDPCHAIYAVAENVASLMAESISGMREAKGYVRIAGGAEDEYMPAGPPMSPLTVSYFTMWVLFDVRFGSSRETMGSCILRIAPEFDCPSWLIDAVERMQRSRMGFYVHCGSEDDGVLLREVGTREIVSCTVPAGYGGSAGEIWFVRVLPPPHPLCRRHIVFNTPYVIRDYPECAYVDYLERELARMKAKKPPRTNDPRGHLMKYGPEPNHWNEFIFSAYSGHRHEAIFLTGIPDIRKVFPTPRPIGSSVVAHRRSNDRKPTMSFSCADNERFNDALVALAEGKYDALVAAYAGKRFENEAARAFASQGFPRRLELMKQCILGSMEPFPSRISWAPSRFNILDAVIHLQAFVVNARGCTDNLAHVWVREQELTGEDGAPLADAEVGFAPGNEAVLDSLSPEFASHLRDLGPWFEYLGRFLHALEHHVPLYVPGDTVSQETLRTFEEMGERIGDAELRGDREEADRMTRERSALVSFFPIVAHAFGEDAKKGVFQFQMMTDFETVVEIAQRLLLELD